MKKIIGILLIILVSFPMIAWGQGNKQKTKVFKVNVFDIKLDDKGSPVMNKKDSLIFSKISGKYFLHALKDSSIDVIFEDQIINYPIQKIGKVKFKRKGNVGKGMAIGMGAAVVATGVVALAGGGLGTVIPAFFGGIFGPPVGAIIGSNVGHTYWINGELQVYQQMKSELQQYLFIPK